MKTSLRPETTTAVHTGSADPAAAASSDTEVASGTRPRKRRLGFLTFISSRLRGLIVGDGNDKMHSETLRGSTERGGSEGAMCGCAGLS